MLVTAPGYTLDVDRGPDWLFVKIGNLEEDGSEVHDLAGRLWSLLDRHFTYRLVLELEEVQVLRSALIGQLVMLHKRVCVHGGMVRLCGLSASNQEALHTCRLDDRFRPYGNRVEAVMASCPRKAK